MRIARLAACNLTTDTTGDPEGLTGWTVRRVTGLNVPKICEAPERCEGSKGCEYQGGIENHSLATLLTISFLILLFSETYMYIFYVIIM